ncbi:MAG: DUF4386 domain-containing protein [Terracidiphilus sp.]
MPARHESSLQWARGYAAIVNQSIRTGLDNPRKEGMSMSKVAMVDRIRDVSPRLKARMAGGLYFFTLLGAQLLETAFPGKMNLAAGCMEILGMTVVTLILYAIFRPANRAVALLAGAFNLAGITLEAIRLTSHGTDIAMVFHGVFCILTGYLIHKSSFLPRVLGALIAFGGLSWLTYLSPSLESYLSPYNLACGLIGEASVFLWLLAMGVNMRRWNEQAAPAGADLP